MTARVLDEEGRTLPLEPTDSGLATEPGTDSSARGDGRSRSAPSRQTTKSQKLLFAQILKDGDSPRRRSRQPSSASDRPRCLCCGCWPLPCCIPQLDELTRVVHPLSRRKRLWDGVISVAVLYLVLIVPWEVAFHYHSFGVQSECRDWRRCPREVMDEVVWLLLVLDMLLSFSVGYIEADGSIVLEPKQVAWRYATRWWIVDLLSVFPVNTLTRIDMGLTEASLQRLLRMRALVKWFRFLRIRQLSRIGSWIVKATNFVTCHSSHHLGRLMELLCFMLLIAHLVSCLWITTAGVVSSRWLMYGEGANGPDTWVRAAGMQDASQQELYLSSMYWAVMTLSTVGYGDISATNSAEMVFSTLVMLAGASLYAWVVSNVSAVMLAIDRERDQRNQKKQQIDDFVRSAQLPGRPSHLRRRVRLFFKHQVRRPSGPMSQEARALVGELSDELRVEVLLWCHRHLVRRVAFFGELLRLGHHGFVAEALQQLSPPRVVPPGGVVVKQGAMLEAMLFVVRGSFGVFSDGAWLRTVAEGEYFGAEGCILGSPSVGDMRAVGGPGETQALRRNALLEILGGHPDVMVLMAEKGKRWLRSIHQQINKLPQGQGTQPLGVPPGSRARKRGVSDTFVSLLARSEQKVAVGDCVMLRGTGRWSGTEYQARVVEVRDSDGSVKVVFSDGGFKRFDALDFAVQVKGFLQPSPQAGGDAAGDATGQAVAVAAADAVPPTEAAAVATRVASAELDAHQDFDAADAGEEQPDNAVRTARRGNAALAVTLRHLEGRIQQQFTGIESRLQAQMNAHAAAQQQRFGELALQLQHVTQQLAALQTAAPSPPPRAP